MKIIFLLFLVITSTSAVANDGPWYNDQGDCRRHWWDYQEGARIRQGQKTDELAAIDIYIQAADSARDASEAPKQAAAENYARLDEKRRDREEVFIPYLKRTADLCREMQSLLIGSAAKELSRVKALVEFVSLKLPEEGREANGAKDGLSAAGAAALTLETSDALALSLILDSFLEEKRPTVGIELNQPRAITLGFILDKIEAATEKVEQVHRQLATLLGKLTGENELELSTQTQQLEMLKTDATRAFDLKTKTDKTYADAVAKAQALKSRKSDLPRDIRSEELTKGVGLQHIADCQQHFSPRNPEHGHGGGGRL